MTIVRKVLGALAAIAVTLVAMSGAGAQTSDTETLTTTVSSPMCAINRITSFDSDSLGTWEWNGTEYQETSGDNSARFTVSFLSTPYGGCDIVVAFTGLTDASGTNHIAPGNFEAWGINQTEPRDPLGWTDLDYPAAPLQSYRFGYTLVSVPNDLSAGVYTGTVKVFVANAA